MPELSIIILSYNTREITFACLNTLYVTLQDNPSTKFEIIVIDNGSVDDSKTMLRRFQNKVSAKNISYKVIFNRANKGFTKGNNIGLKEAKGKYILFLNSDIIVNKINWQTLVKYMGENPYIGALTVRVELPNGSIDPASHRGFPTIWNSFCYYSKLEKLTSIIPVLNRVFGGYHRVYQRLKTIHDIDSPSGAFFFSRADILRELQGFDETFFMYGEDIDMAFRIKEKGYKVRYYPDFSVTHLKYQSGLKKESSKTQNKTHNYFYEAMKIFYKKHYEKKNYDIVNKFVYFFIDIKSRL